ncbi:hypothetical protein G9C98_006921 [Cotesia typhae]|uniref:Lipase n=1 Tax=Cotesia typhae TaxID=2053667 RepID=A0A8J5UTF4_9HYME|nr:hypothetical protein G9C98_006921 [Cotesia typhae]
MYCDNYLIQLIMLSIITNFTLALSVIDVITFFPNSFADVPLTLNDNVIDYNPDVDLPAEDMIKRAGYPAEVHVITTDDGYLLSLHRIPGKPAYLLSDAGYDVWLGNIRGNTYSRAHINLSPQDSQFWNFSFHEMGIYDVPAAVSYIVEKTNMSLVYIGHSMGTTMGYVMASERPEIAEKIKVMISLAPIGFMSHLKSPVRIVAPFANDIKTKLLERDGYYGETHNVTTEDGFILNLHRIPGKLNSTPTLLNPILSNYPAGTSFKNLIHFSQDVEFNVFAKYDYGEEENVKIYNSSKPTDYDLSKVTSPTALIYSEADWYSNPTDVEALFDLLPNIIDVHIVDHPKFTHMDFLWAIDAKSLVYDHVIDLVKKFSDQGLKNDNNFSGN